MNTLLKHVCLTILVCISGAACASSVDSCPVYANPFKFWSISCNQSYTSRSSRSVVFNEYGVEKQFENKLILAISYSRNCNNDSYIILPQNIIQYGINDDILLFRIGMSLYLINSWRISQTAGIGIIRTQFDEAVYLYGTILPTYYYSALGSMQVQARRNILIKKRLPFFTPYLSISGGFMANLNKIDQLSTESTSNALIINDDPIRGFNLKCGIGLTLFCKKSNSLHF